VTHPTCPVRMMEVTSGAEGVVVVVELTT
jgi:hypothetical protein